MTASINAANFLMLPPSGSPRSAICSGGSPSRGSASARPASLSSRWSTARFFGTHFNSRFVIEKINYASQALKIIENLGLVFFVTSVGFIAGPNFFKNMKHNFKSYVLLGVVIILSGGLTAIFVLCSSAGPSSPGSRAMTRAS